MDILQPPRIASLGARHIRILHHISYDRVNEIVLEHVYPFETVFSLKQRLAVLHANEKQWLPTHLFLAEHIQDNQYRPIEFSWPFAITDSQYVYDPLNPETVGKSDTRIYVDGARRADIFPSILSGITIEQAFRDPTQPIHVWNLTTILRAAGFDKTTLPNDEIFQGFFQLYFPTMDTKDAVSTAFQPPSEEDNETFSVLQQYREYIDERLAKLSAGIASDAVQKAKPVTLRELRRLRYMLPKKDVFRTGGLELKFYEMIPTETIPFLRFFPGQDRVSPLIKMVARNVSSQLDNPDILDMFMADQPSTEMGSVLMIKSPIQHPKAPLGTAWTMHIFEDGTAQIYIGAPRKDAPLPGYIVTEAVRVLPAFLAETPWKGTVEKQLVELNAVYECTTELATKPTKSELRARLDPFVPVFMEDTIVKGDSAALSLRYKAVSNFVKDSDPVMNFITTLFLRDSKTSMEDVSIPLYVSVLVKEFGIPPVEASAYIQTWIQRNAEFVVADKEAAIASVNVGSMINLYNTHPKYMFHISNAESQIDLNRILTLLTLFTSYTSKDLHIVKTAAAAAHVQDVIEHVESVQQDTAIEDFSAADYLDMLAFGPADTTDAVDAVVDAAPFQEGIEASVPSAPLVPSETSPIVTPVVLAEDEKIDPIEDGWYLKRLVNRDPELFEYKTRKGDARVQVYSRTCQKSQEKQPHVMAPETYARARALYGDAVFWVEAPLSPQDLLAVTIASKSAGERDKVDRKKKYAELVALEIRALTLGFPLKDNKSIVDLPTFSKQVLEKDRTELARLSVLQRSKPLWTVMRMGSNLDKPNYYICAELWCVRDDLPIIPEEFRGTRYRDGNPKNADSCPFCGGRLIVTYVSPKPGETVLKRPPTTPAGPIAQYVGFQKKLYHPDKFALPCCFVSPDDLHVPADAHELPPVKVPQPDTQHSAEATAEPVPPRTEPVPPAAPVADAEKDSRDRPFAVKHKTAQNKFYIPHQNILGRSSEDWFQLEKGTVAVPPKSVNKLLGQDPETFLTSIKGVRAQSQNSYLTTPAVAFVRYGIGGSIHEPGTNLISLIAYAQYATQYLLSADDTLAIPSNATVLRTMLETKEYELLHAFEQANYGTLLHEFSMPGHALPAEEELQFQAWWSRIQPVQSDQRAYAVNLYLAWNNFKNYVRDTKEPKGLRIWESLFACPGLLTPTGVMLVTIRYPKGKDKPAVITCPTFGVSLHDQQTKPPLLLLLEDSVTGLYDPLVFYEGVSKDEKRLLGVLQADTPQFGTLSAAVREPLRAFLEQYYTSSEGCKRTAESIHPWYPVLTTTGIPKLGNLVAALHSSDLTPMALFRDRSNRVVGMQVKWDGKAFYIPCMDDGILLPMVPSIRGEHALPQPPLQNLLEMLTGAQKVIRPTKITAAFPGLLPAKLVVDIDRNSFVALELQCGALIPFEPFSLDSSIKHRRFVEMNKPQIRIDMPDVMPWDADIALLGPSSSSSPSTTAEDAQAQTSEEILNEAYQHVRISFSNWLHTSDGHNVMQQIELLRQARRRLPLFELQKRLDILLTAILANPMNPWLTEEGTSYGSILRRDCLQIKTKKECIAGCSWIPTEGDNGVCRIHTSRTPRYMDPIRVIIARLVDELLRTFGLAQEILTQHVPHLRSLSKDAIVEEEHAILFSASGRGTDALYDRLGYKERRATKYARGYTYPEEVGVEIELPADWAQLRHALFGADIARDPRARLDASLVSITSKPLAELERTIGHPFTGTEADWKALAIHTGIEVLLTRVNPMTRIVEIKTWLGSEKEARAFLIVDLEGIPMQHSVTHAFILTEREVPDTVRAWMDTHTRV